MIWKVEWKSVTTASGAQSVVMRLDSLKCQWYADSWDFHLTVSHIQLSYHASTESHNLCNASALDEANYVNSSSTQT